MQPLVSKMLRTHHTCVAATLARPKHQIERQTSFRPEWMPLLEEGDLLFRPGMETVALNFVGPRRQNRVSRDEPLPNGEADQRVKALAEHVRGGPMRQHFRHHSFDV